MPVVNPRMIGESARSTTMRALATFQGWLSKKPPSISAYSGQLAAVIAAV